MQEQKKSQNQMIATNDLSSKAVEAETMADEKPKATLRAGEYDWRWKAGSLMAEATEQVRRTSAETSPRVFPLALQSIYLYIFI